MEQLVAGRIGAFGWGTPAVVAGVKGSGGYYILVLAATHGGVTGLMTSMSAGCRWMSLKKVMESCFSCVRREGESANQCWRK